MAERRIGRFELLERSHQRLGHVAAAEVALHPPPPGAVRLEQRGVDRRRAEGDVRAVVAGGLGAFHEQRDAERILARPLPGDAWRLDAAGHVHSDGRDRPQRLGDVGRVQAAGQDDGHLPGNRRGTCGRRPPASPAKGVGGGGVHHDPSRPCGEVAPGGLEGGRRRRSVRVLGRNADHLPERARQRPRLAGTAPLDGVRIHCRHDRRDLVRPRIGDHGNDCGSTLGRRGDPHEPRQLGRLSRGPAGVVIRARG